MKYVITTLLVIFLPIYILIAQKHRIEKRTITLDSRYFFQSYSNKTVGQFGTELFQLAGLPANLLINIEEQKDSEQRATFLFYTNSQARQVGNGLLKIFTSALLSSGYTFAFHEYGHGTRASAIGFRIFYGHGTIRNEDDYLSAISGAIKLYDDFSSLYLASLFKTGGLLLINLMILFFLLEMIYWQMDGNPFSPPVA